MKKINYIKLITLKVGTYCGLIRVYAYYTKNMCFNYLLWFFGYQRIYDIDTGTELTLMYHLMKIMKYCHLKGNNKFDVVKRRIGICKNTKTQCERYILYNKKITDTKEKVEIAIERYHDVIKIEIDRNGEMIDVTEAKMNYYCVKNGGMGERDKICDMIKFYLLTKRIKIELPVKVKITRKYFDSALLKHTQTTEVINIM